MIHHDQGWMKDSIEIVNRDSNCVYFRRQAGVRYYNINIAYLFWFVLFVF
jgi:hypothetical protein